MQLPNARSAGCEHDRYVQVRRGITFVAGGCLSVLLMILTQLLYQQSGKTQGGERLEGWETVLVNLLASPGPSSAFLLFNTRWKSLYESRSIPNDEARQLMAQSLLVTWRLKLAAGVEAVSGSRGGDIARDAT